MKKASWIVLTVLGVAVILLSVASAVNAYTPSEDYAIGGQRVSRVAEGDAGILAALRGIRGTSAAYGAAFGVLFLIIAGGPYRRGETWAWWALLAAGALHFAMVILRVPLIGTTLGVTPAIIQGGLLVLGLALDAGRLRRPRV